MSSFYVNILPKLLVYEILFYLIKRSLAIIVLLPFLSAGQEKNKIDSLNAEIENRSGIDKYDPLISLVVAYASTDYSKALDKINEAFVLAHQHGDTAKIVKAGRIKGQILNKLDRVKESTDILSQMLPMAKRNNFKNDYKIILNSLAYAHALQADYANALNYNFQSLELREADGDKSAIAITLTNIGFVYYKMQNIQDAVQYFDRALKLKREVNDKHELDRVLINLGLCYNQLKNFEVSEKYLRDAFEVCGDNCDPQIKTEGEFALGSSYFNQGKFEEAKTHFNISLTFAVQTHSPRFEAENYFNLSRIAITQSRPELAEESLNKLQEIALKNNYTELLLQSYRQFSILNIKTNDYKKASDYQNKYIQLKDSVFSDELIRNLATVQTNYAERVNLKTIADKEEVIERQRILNVAIVIIAILASLLIFVLYWSNHVKKKVNQALSDAKLIIEDQNRQLLSSNFNLDKELKEKNTELQRANESLSKVNEELDNFIYKTSHDIRGPLASLKGMCNVALMDVHDPVALNYLKKLDITADKLNTILTRLLIVNQINNSTLASEPIDFNDIIHDLLLLEKKKGLPPHLIIRSNVEPNIDFSSDKEFVRIILENLIDNAIKFYNDSDRINPFVDISIVEEKNQVKIKVLDNGIGISEVHPDKIFQMFSRASERSETGGIGLYITKTAAEKLGGYVNLKTTPEGFTEFSVLLPMAGAKVMA